jgi:hypothetical protein
MSATIIGSRKQKDSEETCPRFTLSNKNLAWIVLEAKAGTSAEETATNGHRELYQNKTK